MFGRNIPVPDGKILQNHGIPPFGHPYLHHTKPMEADPGSFPRKTGSLFPAQELPLFFGHIFIPGHSSVPHDQLIVPFFTIKGTRLNCTVFSRLKQPVSKNTCLKRKSCSGLAPFPLERYSLGSGPKTLRRRMNRGRGHVRPPPPIYNGSPARMVEQHTTGRAGSCNQPAPTIRARPRRGHGPGAVARSACAGCRTRSPGGPW
jgi:hypothetical protein